MLTLIAADMDGTLLNPENNLSDRFCGLLDRLLERQIDFVVASGRQYQNIAEHFTSYRDKIFIISENGACIFFQNRCLYHSVIEKELLAKLYQTADTFHDGIVIVSGPRTAYIKKTSRPEQLVYLAELIKYYANIVVVDRYEDIPMPVTKYTVCHFGGVHKHVCPHLDHIAQTANITISKDIFVDITSRDANKGHALAFVQSLRGHSPDTTMAFGDYLNDVELLERSRYSFAMENAHPDLFSHARFTAPSNADDGVADILSTYLASPDRFFELYR